MLRLYCSRSIPGKFSRYRDSKHENSVFNLTASLSKRLISYVINNEGKLYFLMDHGLGNEGKEQGQGVKIFSPLTSNEINDSIRVKDNENIVNIINDRYDEESNSNFVGGMGENDPGVWFTCVNGNETLDTKYANEIQRIISEVKEHRHGVPFGLHTSGVNDSILNLAASLNDIGLSFCEVSLGAADPMNYAKVMMEDNSSTSGNVQFGKVCSFIVTASESGFPVEVGVRKEFLSTATDLATSLGAVKVNSY